MSETVQPEFRELIRTAIKFERELIELGYGSSSDLPLPGSYDTFVIATKAAREKLDDAATEEQVDE